MELLRSHYNFFRPLFLNFMDPPLTFYKKEVMGRFMQSLFAIIYLSVFPFSAFLSFVFLFTSRSIGRLSGERLGGNRIRNVL